MVRNIFAASAKVAAMVATLAFGSSVAFAQTPGEDVPYETVTTITTSTPVVGMLEKIKLDAEVAVIIPPPVEPPVDPEDQEPVDPEDQEPPIDETEPEEPEVPVEPEIIYASGVIQFRQGSTIVATVPVFEGKASAEIDGYSAMGVRSFTATFVPNTGFLSSLSSSIQVTIDKAKTKTKIMLSPEKVNYRLGEEFVVEVLVERDPPSSIPQGVVDLQINGIQITQYSNIPYPMLQPRPTLLPAGNYIAQVYYRGSAEDEPSYAYMNISIEQQESALQASAEPAAAATGQEVTFSAKITGPGAGASHGYVRFFNGEELLSEVDVDLATTTATFKTSSLPQGTHVIKMVYSGNLSLGGAEGFATVAVGPTQATIGLTSNVTVLPVGQRATLTATVLGTSGNGNKPTGWVDFIQNGAEIGSAQVSPTTGRAVLQTGELISGSHGFTAAYRGDAIFSPVSTTSPLFIDVGSTKAVTTTTLTPTSASAFPGNPLTFTARVTSPIGTPDGFVEFFVDNVQVGAAVELSAAGRATLTDTFTSGEHVVTARYVGNESFAVSASNSATVSVAKSDTFLSVSYTPNDPASGDIVVIRAEAFASSDTGSKPSGTVRVLNGVNIVGNGSMADGVAIIEVVGLPTGSHSLKIEYDGDVGHNGSNQTVPLTISTARAEIEVSSSPMPSSPGQSVTLTANLRGSAGTPQGSVRFYVNGNSVGLSTIVNGQATLLISSPPADDFLYYAVYSASLPYVDVTSITKEHYVASLVTSTVGSVERANITYGTSNSVNASVTSGSGIPQGSVKFSIGDRTFTAQLSEGMAYSDISELPPGEYTGTATYAGNSTFLGSTSAPFSLSVAKAATEMMLMSSANPANSGAPISFTAAVSTNALISSPSGKVRFTTSIGSVEIPVENGIATWSTSQLPQGEQLVEAEYLGDLNFLSSSASMTQIITAQPASVSVSSSNNPKEAYSSVDIYANVSPVAATGNVVFTANGIEIGTAPINGGRAVISWDHSTPGTYTIVANYQGDAVFGPTSGTYTQVIGKSATELTLTTPVQATPAGESIVFTAKVDGVSPATVVPTGQVTFRLNSVDVHTVDLVNGVAQYTATDWGVGQYNLQAFYNGSVVYNGSSKNLFHQVSGGVSEITLTSDGTTFEPGEQVGLSVDVTASVQAGAYGEVRFISGGVTIGTETLVDGRASISWIPDSSGVKSIVAIFDGNEIVSGSTADAVEITVVELIPDISAAFVSPSPSEFGQSVDLTITVPYSRVAPTGSVDIFIGSQQFIGTFTNGSTVVTINGLPVGTSEIEINYPGDKYYSSASHNLSQVVTKATSSLLLMTEPSPSVYGQSIFLIATGSGAGSPPTGDVEFFVRGNSIGVAPMVSGTARIEWQPDTTGDYDLRAEYEGDVRYFGSNDTYTHSVYKAETTVTLSIGNDVITTGETTTATATIMPVSPGAGSPTGTVTFTVDGVQGEPVAIVSGRASITTHALSAGNKVISAVYSGDNHFQVSAGSGSVIVNKLSPTISVVKPNSITVSETGIFNVSISSSVANLTGFISMEFDGRTVRGELIDGEVSLDAVFSTPGLKELIFTFEGNEDLNTASRNETITVSPGNSVTTISSISENTVYGSTATFRTVVTDALNGDVVNSGNVTYIVGTAVNEVVEIIDGVATLQTTALPVGVNTIVAKFGGNAVYDRSETTLEHNVVQASPEIDLTSSTSSPYVGQSVNFTATVELGNHLATGAVVFFANDVAIGSATLSSGVASYQHAFTESQNYVVKAVYSGDTNFQSKTSSDLNLFVEKGNTSISANQVGGVASGGKATISIQVNSVAPAIGTPEGNVTILMPGVGTYVSTLANGEATIETDPINTGSYSFAVNYNGDAYFNGSDGTGVVSVAAGSTSTTVTSSKPISAVGEQITLTATVTPSSTHDVTGSVEFREGDLVLGVRTVQNGMAEFEYSSDTRGTKLITAYYDGDSNYLSSTSAAIEQAVIGVQTVTDVTGPVLETTYGETAIFTVSVVGDTVIDGNVTLYVNGVSAGVKPLVGGYASYDVSDFAVGSAQYSASYAGNNVYEPSSSVEKTHTIVKASTATVINVAPIESVFGETLALTASVTSEFTDVVGQVVFYSNMSNEIGRSSISLGEAVINFTPGEAGQVSVHAEYLANDNFEASTSSVANHTVNKGQVNVSATLVSDEVYRGENAEVEISVTPVHPSLEVPTGVVYVSLGGGQPIALPLSNGAATYISDPQSTGQKTISVHYAGSDNYQQANAESIELRVLKERSTLRITHIPSLAYGENAVIETAITGNLGEPYSGSVEFYVNGNLVSTGSPGIPSMWLVDVVGEIEIEFRFLGNEDYEPSSDRAIVTVSRAQTSSTLNLGSHNFNYGEDINVSVGVSSAIAHNNPTGEVIFYVNGVEFQRNNLAFDGLDYKATFNLIGIDAGEHFVEAKYVGSTEFEESYSGIMPLWISQVTPQVSIVGSSDHSRYGDSIDFTVTVSHPYATPTGQIGIFVNSNLVSDTVLENGSATFSIVPDAIGDVHIYAKYLGNNNFLSEQSTATIHTVMRASTQTVLSSDTLDVVVGNLVNIKAKVNAVGNSIIPEGEVEFIIDGDVHRLTLDANGEAVVAHRFLNLDSAFAGVRYIASSRHEASIADQLTFNVVKATPGVTVSSSATPSVVGEQVVLSASVDSGNSEVYSPTGNVTFIVNGEEIRTVPTANGIAAINWTPPSVGSYSIAVNFAGDSYFDEKLSSSITQSVSNALTTTTILPIVQTVYGDTANVSVVVGAVAPATGTPTGTVTIEVEGALKTESLTNGVANFSVTWPHAGDITIVANYSGDADFATSQSNVDVAVGKSLTTTTLALGSSFAYPGASVSLTAHVSGAAGSVNDGVVIFTLDGAEVASADVINNVASASAVFNMSGDVEAKFRQSRDYADSSSYSEYIYKVKGDVSVRIDAPNYVTVGGSAEININVEPVSPSILQPEGNVELSISGQPTITLVLSGGRASYTMSNVAAGSYNISAQYLGSLDYNSGSTSGSTTSLYTVLGATNTTLSTSPNPSAIGQDVTFKADVYPVGGGTLTGSVTFKVDGSVIGISPVSNGVATMVWSGETNGVRQVVATYSGDLNFGSSSSASIPHSVNSSSTMSDAAITLSVPGGIVSVGSSIEVTARVSSIDGVSIPTGNVVFYMDGVSIGTSTLVNGSVSVTSPALQIGNRVFTAYYVGDVDFRSASSLAVIQSVDVTPTNVELISSRNPALIGEVVTFTATVSAGSGSVDFVLDGNVVETVALSGRTATWSRSFAEGVYSVEAKYSGDLAHAPSQSNVINQIASQNGMVTIKQRTSGKDATFTFRSSTPELNLSITTVNGTGSSPSITLPAGTYTIEAQDMSMHGLALTYISCSNGTGNAPARTAIFQVDPATSTVCTFSSIDTRAETVEQIQSFLDARASLIMSNLPSMDRRVGRLNGNNGGEFNPGSFLLGYASTFDGAPYSFSGSLSAFDAATGVKKQSDFDAWIELSGGQVNSGDKKGNYGIVSAGVDYLIDQNMLVGVLVMADTMKLEGASSSVEGTGWMVGPYMTMRISDNLYFDLLGAAGTSKNKISPYGTYEDEFSGIRYLVDASLKGQWVDGPWTLSPEISFTYFNEETDEYVDSNGVTIPSVSSGKGQISAGPGASYNFDVDGMDVTVGGKIEGVLEFVNESGVFMTRDPSARLQGNVGVKLDGGAAINFTLMYDGVGRDNSSIGGKLGVNANF